MSVEFLDCVERERDISIKPMFNGGKTAAQSLHFLLHISHGFTSKTRLFRD